MRYIFLDIDGVLNCSTTKSKGPYDNPGIETGKVRILQEIVNRTQAELVLISDWRMSYHPQDHMPKMAEYIDRKLKEFGLVIAGMPPEYRYTDRRKDILHWIDNHPCEGFIILDDCDYECYHAPDMYPHWVKTDAKYGLTRKHIQEAKKKMEIRI